MRSSLSSKLLKCAAVAAGLVLVALGAGAWLVAGQLIATHPAIIGVAPPDLHAEEVSIPTRDSNFVRGWWIQGAADRPSVLLLHGIRGNRLAMLPRARALAQRGWSVLMIDLQGHGESPGDAITMGWRESDGVTASRDWIRQRNPGTKLGVIGVSLGGAAVALGEVPCGFDAVVLESVYSNLHRALLNRLAMRLGPLASAAAPLLELQVRPRLGISADELSPIDRIATLGAPVLVVAGGRDEYTNIDEAQEMLDRAQEPKSSWFLPDAAHVDFFLYTRASYEANVFGFLQQHLGPP